MAFSAFGHVTVTCGLVALTVSSSAFGYQPEAYSNTLVTETQVTDVRPEMLDWWWDNIRTTPRYQGWNEAEHEAFTPVIGPDQPGSLDYSEGAVQTTTDLIGGHRVTSDLTWRERSLAEDSVQYEHHQLTEVDYAGLDGLASPENGWALYEYQADDTLTGLDVRVTHSLPDSVEATYQGYSAALADHTIADMQNLSAFLPDLFQEEFVDGELLTRGSYDITRESLLVKKVVVDQDIKGLTPEMVDWWWDHIDTTARYKQWHPTAHISFEWVVPPANPDEQAYSPGAVQEVTEYIGRYKSNLRITWLDPQEVADEVTYTHWLYAKTDLQVLSDIFPQTLIHEYQLNEDGDGIVMRSTFRVPSFLDIVMPGFTQRLGEHAIQEMQFLQYFLPELFEREVGTEESPSTL